MIALTTTANVIPVISEQLSAGFGRIVTLIPGKSEARLMLSFTGGVSMRFGGEIRSAAFVEVSLFGRAPVQAYDNFTAAVCELLEEVIDVPPENVFIKYSETEHWGWNGHNL